MWRSTIKGLMAHKVRLALTALAIVLGVAFISGTYILTDTMGRAFDGLFRDINGGVAVQVTGIQRFKDTGPNGGNNGGSSSAERVPATLLPIIRSLAGVRAADGYLFGYAQLVGKDGRAVTTGGAPTIGVSWSSTPELNALRLTQGHAPQGPDQVVIDAGTAEKEGLHVGDAVTVLLQGPPVRATIAGVATFGTTNNLLGASLVAFDQQEARAAFQSGGAYDGIDVAARPGVSPQALRDRVQQVLPRGFQAQTGQEAAAASSQDIKKALSFFNIALLVFGFVALFVGAFIIFNTFSILIAQRTRELALLRALGASGAQVRRSVLAEAGLVGLTASGAGLGLGLLVALGLQALLKGFGIDLPTTSAQVLPRTVLVSLIVGTGTTVVSSIAPAIRAWRIAPVAAMREAAPATYHPSRRRTAAGLAVTALGALALGLGLFGNVSRAAALVGLGAAVVFLGVAVLSPLIARPLARVIGAPMPRMTGKLGRENAMRNPKRTASTAAALMVGLGLVAFVSIFAASVKASANQALEQTVRADYIINNSQFQSFSSDIAVELARQPELAAVEPFRFGTFGYRGRGQSLFGVDPSKLRAVVQVTMRSGSASALGDGDVLVYRDTAEANGWHVGQSIPAVFARTGLQRLTITGIYTDNRLLGNYVVSLGTYRRNFVSQLDQFVLVKSAPAVSQARARAAVERVAKGFPNVTVQDQAQFRASQARQIDQLLGLITALLGLAILIALFGIVNTLALSVFERTRELGLLRAVGMVRRQVRAMIRWESVIIAVFGAILGTAIGVFFGWAMVRALNDQGITALALPAAQLLIYIALAAMAGVIAAIFPARRAARLDVLKAIATE